MYFLYVLVCHMFDNYFSAALRLNNTCNRIDLCGGDILINTTSSILCVFGVYGIFLTCFYIDTNNPQLLNYPWCPMCLLFVGSVGSFHWFLVLGQETCLSLLIVLEWVGLHSSPCTSNRLLSLYNHLLYKYVQVVETSCQVSLINHWKIRVALIIQVLNTHL